MYLGVKFEVAIEQIDESDQLRRDQKQSKFQLDQEQAKFSDQGRDAVAHQAISPGLRQGKQVAKDQDQAKADNHEQYLRHYFPSLQKQTKHLF